MVKVAVGQFTPGTDKIENLAQIETLVGAAAAQGAEVLVLPEYSSFTAPVTDSRFVETAEPLDGTFVTAISGLSARHKITVVAGLNEALSGDSDRMSNTLVALDADGALAATYRKLHLYDAFGNRESDVVRAGDIDTPETFVVAGFTFGLQTCYDLRFPEVTRRIVDAGADALLLPAQWFPGPLKEDHWITLLRARAIENTMYVAAAGQSAPTGSGQSVIVDPMGVILASAGEQVGTTASAVLSGERIQEVRSRNPALQLRSFTVGTRC